MSVQAGAYNTAEAATAGVAALGSKGFGGFAVVGDGAVPGADRRWAVGADAEALCQPGRRPGVHAFVRG